MSTAESGEIEIVLRDEVILAVDQRWQTRGTLKKNTGTGKPVPVFG